LVVLELARQATPLRELLVEILRLMVLPLLAAAAAALLAQPYKMVPAAVLAAVVARLQHLHLTPELPGLEFLGKEMQAVLLLLRAAADLVVVVAQARLVEPPQLIPAVLAV
jgi:hypothetical protein